MQSTFGSKGVPAAWPRPAGRGAFVRAALLAACGPVVLAAVAPAARAQSVPVVESYIASGTGTVRISGPACCDRDLPGVFEAAYVVEPGWRFRLTRLSAELADVDVTFPGFLGLFPTTVPIRCASLSTPADVAGTIDATGGLHVATGAARLEGVNFKTRGADGNCQVLAFVLDGANSAPLTGIHDPVGDTFRLWGRFSQTHEGDTYDVTLDMRGRYRQRPPTTQLAFFRPGEPQGSCPAVWRHGNPSEYVAEANDPAGLKGSMRSLSTDPDGAWPTADIMSEHWSYSDDGGPALDHVADGSAWDPVTYGFGPQHRTRLLVVDRQGAASATECIFRVVDSTPPVVTPPPSRGVQCTRPEGTTSAESPELQAFLDGATARDLVDVSPTLLAPTVGGAAVAPTTVFRLDRSAGGPTRVTFGARDASGNEGRADAVVSVVDLAPPSATLALIPETLPATGSFVTINALLSASDTCGGVRVALESIRSNDPVWDPWDVRDAAWGTDDRSFELATYLTSAGLPRVFEVTYRFVDDGGNERRLTQTVVVSAGGF